jgi:hypothetical protein
MIIVTYVMIVIKMPIELKAKIIFMFNFGYLSYMHIHRMIYGILLVLIYSDWGGWTMDATAFTMMLCCRLSSLGHCLKDGTKDESKLNKTQKDNKIVENPSLLEVFGFSFFIGGCISGPFIEFNDYKKFINEEEQYKIIPSTLSPMIKKILEFCGKQHILKS